jgi:uncharacterized protein YrrD
MQRKIKNLIGFEIGATDGEIGEVKEFYFDDLTWTIRYLIVETGNWLNNRKVLIATEALLTTDWENKVFLVNLTKEKIKNSPHIDTELPVSRQHEIEMYQHYPWTNYWGGGVLGGGMGVSGMMTGTYEPFEEAVKKNKSEDTKDADNDLHLRSTRKVTGYTIHANNGEIGDVEDFMVDDITWKIEFLEVDTGDWFPGKKVLISPKLVKEIKWERSEVVLNISIEKVKNSPEYEPTEEISVSYTANLQNYYGNFI